MKIIWYGTASVLVTTKEQSLLFDPYLKCLLKGQEPQSASERRLRAFQAQRTIFITHGHFDHLASISELYKERECQIYLTKTPYKRLRKEGVPQEKLRLIAPDEEIRLSKDVVIRTVQGKHMQLKKMDMLKESFSKRHFAHPIRKLKLSVQYCQYHERGEILFYEIFAEGKRIQLMGSANLRDDVEYATGADLLILPHQGRSDIDEFNQKIVQRLQPKRVLLDHYDDAFPPYSKDVFVDDFCEKMSRTVPTQKLIEGEPVEL